MTTRKGWALEGVATCFAGSWGAGQRVSPALPAAVRRAAPAPMQPPHAPQPLPCARTTFDAVLHAERPTPLLPSPPAHQLAACTPPPDCLDRPSSRAPCPAPFVQKMGRAGWSLESSTASPPRRETASNPLKHRTCRTSSRSEYDRQRFDHTQMNSVPRLFCGAERRDTLQK